MQAYSCDDGAAISCTCCGVRAACDPKAIDPAVLLIMTHCSERKKYYSVWGISSVSMRSGLHIAVRWWGAESRDITFGKLRFKFRMTLQLQA